MCSKCICVQADVADHWLGAVCPATGSVLHELVRYFLLSELSPDAFKGHMMYQTLYLYHTVVNCKPTVSKRRHFLYLSIKPWLL